MLLHSNRSRQSLDSKAVSGHMGAKCRNDGNLEICKAETKGDWSEVICNIECECIVGEIINWTAFKSNWNAVS